MPIVGSEEALERVQYYFHTLTENLPPGHSFDAENCWACAASVYALLTPIKKQQARSSFPVPA